MKRPFDPGARARGFPYEPAPWRQSLQRQVEENQRRAGSALALATQPESDTRIEYLTSLPDPTSSDIGRHIVVREPGTNQTVTYVGTLTADGTIVWLETAGTTDFVAYSWVRTYVTTNGTMADVNSDGIALTTRSDDDVIFSYDPVTGAAGVSFFGATVANSCAVVAGGKQAQTPTGIAILDTNTIFVSYRDCHRVFVLDDATDAAKGADFVLGSGVPGAGTNDFNQPRGLDHDGESLFVADTGNHRIVKRSLAPPYPWQQTIGASGAGDGQLSGPRDVAVDQSGNLYVADTGNHRIQKFTAAGSFVWKIGGPTAGSGEAQFSAPGALALDPRGRLHVVDTGNHRVKVYDQSGNFLTSYGNGPGSGDEQFSGPTGIAFLATGLAVVIDYGNDRSSVWTEGPFIPGEEGIVPQYLNDLQDVTITSPAAGSFLRRIGSVWTDAGLVITTRTASDSLPDNTNHNVTVNCVGSEVVTGGGCGSHHEGVVVNISRPQGQGWYCQVRNEWGGAGSKNFTAYAVCLRTNG